MPEVVFVRVHEPDQVREIIMEADAIAGEYDVGTPEWIATFNKAVDLLSESLPLVPQMKMANFPFELPNLRG